VNTPGSIAEPNVLNWHHARGAALTYGALQLLVGFQVALIAVAMHLKLGFSLSAALATSIPLGLPLVVIQGSALFLWWRSREPQALAIQTP